MALFWLLSGAVNAKLNDITLCSDVFAFDGRAYFCAEHADLGKELFRTNGTNEGTFVVKDIDIGPGSSSPGSLFEFNGALFFVAETTQTGYGLWRSDGTDSGTRFVTNLDFDGFRSSGLRIINILAVNDELFIQFEKNLRDNFLVRTDGTSSGTVVLDAIVENELIRIGVDRQRTSYIHDNDELYFVTRNILYKLDLSNNNIVEVVEFPPLTSTETGASIVEGSLSGGSFLIEDYGLTDDVFHDVLRRSDGT